MNEDPRPQQRFHGGLYPDLTIEYGTDAIWLTTSPPLWDAQIRVYEQVFVERLTNGDDYQ